MRSAERTAAHCSGGSRLRDTQHGDGSTPLTMRVVIVLCVAALALAEGSPLRPNGLGFDGIDFPRSFDDFDSSRSFDDFDSSRSLDDFDSSRSFDDDFSRSSFRVPSQRGFRKRDHVYYNYKVQYPNYYGASQGKEELRTPTGNRGIYYVQEPHSSQYVDYQRGNY